MNINWFPWHWHKCFNIHFSASISFPIVVKWLRLVDSQTCQLVVTPLVPVMVVRPLGAQTLPEQKLTYLSVLRHKEKLQGNSNQNRCKKYISSYQWRTRASVSPHTHIPCLEWVHTPTEMSSQTFHRTGLSDSESYIQNSIKNHKWINRKTYPFT